jgi:hypothetical protein
MDPFAELLKIYREHSTAEVESNGALLLAHFRVPDAEALLAINGYKEAFSLVSTCAALVDRIAVLNAADPVAQVRESIRLMRRMIDDCEPTRKVDATRALVEGRLYRAWPTEHKTFYDKKKSIIEWRDFFVSYTNRDAPAMNEQFRDLIRGCLGQIPRGDEKNLSYLARVITRHLRRYQGLSGFFDEDDLKVGESIQDEVSRYCTRVFALVQLIEPLALEKEPPRNWCFHEYSHFTENPDVRHIPECDDRHFFVVAGGQLDTVLPANLPPAYRSWVQRIERLKYVSLQNERNSTLRAKIKKIAEEILLVRAQVIEAWLGLDAENSKSVPA